MVVFFCMLTSKEPVIQRTYEERRWLCYVRSWTWLLGSVLIATQTAGERSTFVSKLVYCRGTFKWIFIVTAVNERFYEAMNAQCNVLSSKQCILLQCNDEYIPSTWVNLACSSLLRYWSSRHRSHRDSRLITNKLKKKQVIFSLPIIGYR